MRTLESPPEVKDNVSPWGHDDEPAAQPQAHVSRKLGVLSLHEELPMPWEQIDAVLKSHAQEAREAVHNAYEKQYLPITIPAAATMISYGEEHVDLPPTWPTAAQIKRERLDVRLLSKIFGFFSQRLAVRFDRYVQHRARPVVMQRLRRFTDPIEESVETIGQYAAPREQFLAEMDGLYRQTAPQGDTHEPSASKIGQILGDLRRTVQSRGKKKDSFDKRYPLTSQFITLAARLSPGSFLGGMLGTSGYYPYRTVFVKAAAPEIFEGIRQFLQTQGLHSAEPGTQTAPEVRRPIARALAERFAGNRLKQLPAQIATVLTTTYRMLPDDGPAFQEAFYTLCRKISDSSRQGNGAIITDELMRDLLAQRHYTQTTSNNHAQKNDPEQRL